MSDRTESGPPTAAEPLALEREIAWLRRLARSLTRDEHAADDAVQETLAVHLARPNAAHGALRGWLAAVLRNAVRGERRGRLRRETRERSRATEDDAPAADVTAARIEAQRLLAAALASLTEPTRTTIVMRYFDDMPPRRIARAQQTSVATVKSRLQRGLRELRARLDEVHGGERRSWLGALAPLALPAAGATTSQALLWIGASLMNAKLLGLGVVCLASLLAFFHVRRDTRPAMPAESARLRSPDVELATRGELPVLAHASPARAAVQPSATASPTTSASRPASAAPMIAGIAFDAEGRALVDAGILATDDSARARTTSDGRFALAAPAGTGWIVVDEPGWATALMGSAKLAPRPSIVVAAPAIDVRGRVVDPSGEPLAGASLDLVLPEEFRGRFDAVVDDSLDVQRGAISAEDGTFALLRLPAVRGARLQVTCHGHAALDLALPGASTSDWRIELQALRAGTAVLEGSVVDELGRAVEGALVVWGDRGVTSDHDGRFRFERAPSADVEALPIAGLGAGDAERTVRAVSRGRLPGSVAALSVDARGRAVWPEPLIVRLAGPALTIRGRVENADGTPRPGTDVWVRGLSLFGRREDGSEAENGWWHAEEVMREGSRGFAMVRSDEHGEFILDGLLPRSYEVTTIDAATVLRVDLAAVPAGTTGLVLRFPAAETLLEQRGRVVDRRGNPLPGVLVRVTTDAFAHERSGRQTSVWHESGFRTTTDDAGRFLVRDLPPERAYLRFSGDEVFAREIGRDESRWPHAGDELLVTLVRRCHFKVECDDPALADGFALLDVAGEELLMTEFSAGRSRNATRMPLTNGRSTNLVAGDDAATLVLYADEREVLRRPLRLAPGELTVVRP